ncbi:hypothetical protein BGW39_010539 [Mortierella sp. 14UC]|nr:hypothetical protein BGW39_010539 [Mortierella sp. 14UC]
MIWFYCHNYYSIVTTTVPLTSAVAANADSLSVAATAVAFIASSGGWVGKEDLKMYLLYGLAPYNGTLALLPEDFVAPDYFKLTPISSWTLDRYLLSCKPDTAQFLSNVKSFSRAAWLPESIRDFALRLHNFYAGRFGQENVEVAKNKALVTANRALLSTKEHIVVQNHLSGALDKEISRYLSPGLFEDPETVQDFFFSFPETAWSDFLEFFDERIGE